MLIYTLVKNLTEFKVRRIKISFGKYFMKNTYLLLSYIILFGVISFQASAQQAPPANVNVIEAELKSLAPVAWVSGTVVSRNNSQLAAEVSGRLISLAELGAEVKRGDIIAQIDDSTLMLQKQENLASVQNAKSRLEYLSSEVTRKSALAKRNLSAKTDLDQTISERDVAKGNLAAAKAQLAQTEQRLGYTKMRAPFDGIIAERLRSQGEYVENSTAIIRLVETQNLEASVFAPITAYPHLTQIKVLAIESAIGQGMANIKTLVPVADSRSHLMEVRLDVAEFNWPVGLSVKVAVANGDTKKVLAVPRDALVLRRDGASIFKVSQDQ